MSSEGVPVTDQSSAAYRVYIIDSNKKWEIPGVTHHPIYDSRLNFEAIAKRKYCWEQKYWNDYLEHS